MLRVNVGLSRKVSKDYNSTGYSINVEGEVASPVTDPEAVTEEIKRFYDLAEEALALQIDRYQGDGAIASRDEQPQRQQHTNGNGHQANGNHGQERQSNGNGNGASAESATNRQIQYLLTLSKKQRLSTIELEHRIAEVLNQQVGIYDLTKRQAGLVIDALAGSNAAAGNRSGR